MTDRQTAGRLHLRQELRNLLDAVRMMSGATPGDVVGWARSELDIVAGDNSGPSMSTGANVSESQDRALSFPETDPSSP